MNETLAKFMTEEEFNSLNEKEQKAVEKDSSLYRSVFNWTYLTLDLRSENAVRTFADRVDWNIVSNFVGNFSDKFFEDFKDKLNWMNVIVRNTLSKDKLLKYMDYINWETASAFQDNIDEEVIEAVMATNHKDEIDWIRLFIHHKFNEEFMKKYANLV